MECDRGRVMWGGVKRPRDGLIGWKHETRVYMKRNREGGRERVK